jgi:hypothetical protein
MRLADAMVVSLALVVAAVLPALAQSDTGCQGAAVHYVFGFATLYSRLADWMGDPLTCEFADPNGTGDVHQRTTQGLAFWRKSTNTPTFTNGNEHWALVGEGMVYWTGSSIDPASDAIAFDSSHPCLRAGGCKSTGSGQVQVAAVSSSPTTAPPAAAPPEVQTYQTQNGPRTAAQLHDELAAAGYGGPWDVGSMLAAYNRVSSAPQAASSSPPPIPPAAMRHDFSAECQAFVGSLPGKIGNKIVLASNMMLNCTFYANRDGTAGLACWESVTQRELTDSIIYSVSELDSRYHDCLGR